MIVKIKSHTLFQKKKYTHIHTCTLFPLKKRKGTKVFCMHLMLFDLLKL